jgi:hypothetical protein
MENLNQQIRKNALTNGLMLGLITLVLGIFSFYFITGMTTSFAMIIGGPIIFSIIIPIVIVILFCIDMRKKIGGYWTFKQAVTGIFIMFLAAYVIQMVGRDFVFAKFIEPNMIEKTQDAMTKATTAMLEKSGTDQATIDSKVADMQKQFDAQKDVSVAKTIEGIGISLILMFVVALIFAAIFKKDPLRFDTTAEPDPTV